MKTRHVRSLTAIAVLSALALVAAACGGDDEEAAPAPAAPQPEAPAPPPPADPPSPPPADEPPPPPPAEPMDEMPSGPPHIAELPWGTFTLADSVADKIANDGEFNFVLSIEGTAIPIFGAAMDDGWSRGASEVSAEHGVDISARLIGPLQTDIPAQVAEIDSLIDAGQIDCLAFEAHEPGPYVDVIAKAVDAGIPVFGVNADSPDSKRFAFFALDELSAGTLAGTLTGEWAVNNGIALEKAGLLTGSVEGPWAQNRMNGFVAGISAVLPDLEFVNGPNTDIESQGWDPPQQYAASEAWILGHPDVDIIFHTDQGVEFVAKVISDQGLGGDMFTSGFNMNPAIADFIREGVVVVTMVQGFSNQAYNGANACGDFLFKGEFETGHVILDPLAATQDNVDAVDWSQSENQ